MKPIDLESVNHKNQDWKTRGVDTVVDVKSQFVYRVRNRLDVPKPFVARILSPIVESKERQLLPVAEEYDQRDNKY